MNAAKITRESKSNLALAFVALSRERRQDVTIFYAFCRLIDDIASDGRCDWVKRVAVPLPLIVIGKQVGVPERDIWRIKAWTDAWVQRLLTGDAIACVAWDAGAPVPYAPSADVAIVCVDDGVYATELTDRPRREPAMDLTRAPRPLDGVLAHVRSSRR